MLERILGALLVGIVTFLVAWIVLALVSFMLPGVTINAGAWAAVLGVIAFLYSVITGRSFVK